MLSFFRALAGTWVARVFFMALAAAFVGWGVANRGSIASFAGGDGVATVDGTAITPQLFALAMKQDMAEMSKRLGDPANVPPELRRMVAQQTLQRLVAQQAMQSHAETLGIATPDSAIAKAVTALPAFQGIDGKFDRGTYLRLLAENNLSPQTFQEQMRQDATRDQILKALTAGAQVPEALAKLIYAYATEGRRADTVVLPLTGRAAPPTPADNVLQRYYANNLNRYTAPEYRRVKLVVLSPATIGRSIAVSDADMHAWLKAHRDEFESPELRDLQVITTGDKATAEALAAKWRGGASWGEMQTAAKAAKASAVALDKTDRTGVPTPELAAAAFAAAPGVVVGPIAEPLGFQLVSIQNIVAARHGDFNALKDMIRQRLGEERAVELVDPKAQKLQDLFAGGSHLDEIPADSGAIGAEGTLDANGFALDGTPAPLPLKDAARKAFLTDVFKASKNDAPQLNEGPDHTWYAFAIQDITKPAPRPFETVRAAVLADWQKDQIHHTQEAAAAHILALVKSGKSLTDAAWGTGLSVIRTAPIQRNGGEGVSRKLAAALFTLKQGQVTMVEDDDAFTVAVLAEVLHPDPAAHAADVASVRKTLNKALSDDLITSYATQISGDAKTSVNQKLLETFTQQPGG